MTAKDISNRNNKKNFVQIICCASSTLLVPRALAKSPEQFADLILLVRSEEWIVLNK